MELIELKRGMTVDEWRSLAAECGTTTGHLNNVAYGTATANAALARTIEEQSGGRVMRWTLRPNDWHVIWAELRGAEGAPDIAAEQGA